MTRRRACLLACSAVLAVSCGSDALVSVPPGEWGGLDAALTVGATGARLMLRCGASGAIEAPLRLDAQARFDLGGTYDPRLVAGGPRPARYTGSLGGAVLVLQVRVEGATLGPFRLTRGGPATFDVCNFASAAPPE